MTFATHIIHRWLPSRINRQPDTILHQINRAFFWFMAVPMLVAAVISIAVFYASVKTEAIRQIEADLKAARLVYQAEEHDIRVMAQTYAQHKAVSFLLPYAASAASIKLKVGIELDRFAKLNALDMVTVVGAAGEVIACSHAPYRAGDVFLDKDYIRAALSGKSLGFTERVSLKELSLEGVPAPKQDDDRQQRLCLTGVAPIYHSDLNRIIGVVILKKFMDNATELVQRIAETLGLHAAMYEGVRMILWARPPVRTVEFVSPPNPVLESVYHQRQSVSSSRFYRGGSLSIHSPILDFNGTPVGILVLQSGIQSFIRGRDTIVTTLIVLLAIGGGLLIILRNFLIRQVVNPIHALNAGAEAIGKGRFEGDLDVVSHNEIGGLTRTFNKMAFQLQTTYRSLENEIQGHRESEAALQNAHAELENRVAERTRELSASNSRLQLEIEERMRTAEKFKEALSEKEVLLREVHHRVKNNLQIIAGLLDMTRNRCADPQVSELLSGACARIHTMAMIHNHLYQSTRFDRINLQEYIRELAAYLSQMYGKAGRISMDIRVENMTLSLIQAMPCALIFNELISNSLKHAFEPDQQGTITISVSAIDNSVSVRYQDDGSGIPEALDLTRVKSLGMKLVNNLIVKQLKGSLRISRNPGTEIVFSFKAPSTG